MITRGQLEKDIARLVEVAHQHLPNTADLFFSKIRERSDRLDDAVRSLPAICYEQALAMVQAARKIGLPDQEICSMALAQRREARCGVSAVPASEEPSPFVGAWAQEAANMESPRPLYSDELEALGYYRQT